MIVTILISLLVFGLLIFVHELGHFLTAKAMGVKVNEFAMGMGPTIFRFGKRETKYAIRLLPIGGFVNMEGEQEYSDHERSFHNKPVWRRILIIVSGSFMNILLGFLLVVIIVSIAANAFPTTTIDSFIEESVSSEYLQEGDKIVSINGTKIFSFADINFTIRRAKDAVYDIKVIRNGDKLLLKDVRLPSGINEDGSKTVGIDFTPKLAPKNIITVIDYSVRHTVFIARAIWFALIDLVTGNVGLKAMSGPVGVVGEIGKAANRSIFDLLSLVSFMSINLGIFNLLPVPALDGGHLVFLTIEGIRRKPINPEHAGFVHLIGFALLILLIITVTFNDIVRLISGA